MTDSPITVDKGRSGWHITLNQPERGNALSPRMVDALDETLQQAEAGRAAAVIFSGSGRHFCTGFDLSSIAQETDDSLLARFVRIELLLQRIHRAPFLSVAHVHGRATGAGADLFAACRLRLAAANAKFSFPGARGFGLILGTRRLAGLVGSDKALSWAESGTPIGLGEALQAGLVTREVDGTESMQDLVLPRIHDKRALQIALGLAVETHHVESDALDLALLVRSAAAPGLQKRVAEYFDTIRPPR